MTAVLAGCASHPNASKPVDWFQVYQADHRIRFEPGAEAFAGQLAAEMDAAVRTVEKVHGAPFLGPVRVYLCATVDCFRFYVTTPHLSAAVVPDNRLILSPRLFGEESMRRQGLLTHELSHLHMGQYIGHYHPNTPIWFHEGLASLAAGGFGADQVTDAQAVEALKAGQRFDPTVRDRRDLRHGADAFGLSVPLFYREAMLFVRYLKTIDEDAFFDFMKRLRSNEDFDIAFGNAYNTLIKSLWHRFVEEMTKDGA
jgi:hypothetical protein